MHTIFLVLAVFSGSISAHAERTKCEIGQVLPKGGTVVKVADGDTVAVETVSGTYSIRMLGIDTPETHYLGHSQGEWGDRAALRLQALLPVGTKVRLELGADKCDKYGRLLAHVFVGKNHINSQMAKEGLAVNYCVYPSMDYCDAIGKHVANAESKRLGMFTDKDVELPYDYRRRVSNRHRTNFVGSIVTKKVVAPEQQDSVPVADRVFFQTVQAVKLPYTVAE